MTSAPAPNAVAGHDPQALGDDLQALLEVAREWGSPLHLQRYAADGRPGEGLGSIAAPSDLEALEVAVAARAGLQADGTIRALDVAIRARRPGSGAGVWTSYVPMRRPVEVVRAILGPTSASATTAPPMDSIGRLEAMVAGLAQQVADMQSPTARSLVPTDPMAGAMAIVRVIEELRSRPPPPPPAAPPHPDAVLMEQNAALRETLAALKAGAAVATSTAPTDWAAIAKVAEPLVSRMATSWNSALEQRRRENAQQWALAAKAAGIPVVQTSDGAIGVEEGED